MGGRNYWLGMWRVQAWGKLERHGVSQRRLHEDDSNYPYFFYLKIRTIQIKDKIT